MYMLLSTFTTSNLLTLSNQEYNHCSLILLYTATEEKLLSVASHDPPNQITCHLVFILNIFHLSNLMPLISRNASGSFRFNTEGTYAP